MSLPMDDIKVLDLSRTLPGPYCTWVLGDMGADIIRVEDPKQIEKHEQMQFQGRLDEIQRKKIRAQEFLLRNRKSLLLDLRRPEARRIILDLVKEQDVLVEDFRPGVMEKMDLDYETIRKINPRIVYCSISMSGQDGPYRGIPGHDPVALALSGLLSLIGGDQLSKLRNIPIGDITTGLNAVIGILLALRARDKDGQGQHVDIGMIDCTMGFALSAFQRYFRTGAVPGFSDSAGIHQWRTKDGKYICTTNMEPKHWERFCEAVGRPDFIPHQYDPSKQEEMIKAVQEIFLTKTRDEWFDTLRKADTQVAPVYSFDEVPDDPHIHHRKMILDVDHPEYGKIRQLGIPIKLSRTPGQIRKSAPIPGENTTEILDSLGYTKEQIQEWVEGGVTG
ncbi:MAG: CoA transferase [Deltaproteobacteria bacterium]|nr:CoA transferase [Deltaproteobacteria bacterium]